MKLVTQVKSVVDATTMYRTVLYVLIGLAVWSVVLAFFGALDFNPLSMVLSLLAVLIAAFCADRLFAYVFRVYPNVESIFITALIIYFLITPAGTPEAFVLIALAGVFAAASKYLLAWRGRHIFNPAATGVFLTGLLGVGYASWWVATPWLLPFVAVGAATVIYKTRHIELVKWYLGAAAVTIVISALLRDTFSFDIFWLILASYPLVFFAGFMLTEPLTLPPRRSQRRSIALIVGVLSYVSFSIGPLSTSPELALLIGNSIGFVAAGRYGIKLIGRHKLAADQLEYQFKPVRPLKFEAGQYLELHIPHARSDARGVRRMFTIASSPRDDVVRIVTRQPQPLSSYKKAMRNLPIGATVRATGVWGDFTLPAESAQKLLLIAGGVGVTPFLSHLSTLTERRDIVLIYAVKDRAEMLDVPSRDGIATYIHEGVITPEVVQRAAPDIRQRCVYVSGPPIMVDLVSRQARELGAHDIRRDFFVGY